MLDVTIKNATKYTVSFPQSAIDTVITPVNVKVIQRPQAHEIAVLDIIGAERYKGLLGGAPVSIDWSNANGEASFRGYVYRLDPHYEPGKYRSTVICVGTSYPLMNQGQEVWVSQTATDVVRDIAFKHGLAYDVDEHPRVYAQVAQAGRSYWQVLAQLADETGYVLRVEGSTIVFRTREAITAFYRPLSPAFDYSSSQAPQLKMLGEVQEFHPKGGGYNPELGAASASRSASGVDPTSGKTINNLADPTTYRGSDAPLFANYLVDVVANNALEVDSAIQAANERNRFTVRARMETLGQPYLAPERSVYLRGLESPYNGYWTVRQVVHEISARNYRCVAEVGSDGLGSTTQITGEQALNPAPKASVATVPAASDKTLGWPYATPVLEASVSVVGEPGRALSDFLWTAPVRRWRTA